MNIEELREFCLSLDGSEEEIKWGTLCFIIEKKIFILISLDDDNRFSVKCDVEEFEMLTIHPSINQAYHLAKRHWIQVENFDDFADDAIRDLVKKSRKLVIDKLPKYIQQKYK